MNFDERYRTQIDGLRAIAVLAVLYSHFWDKSSALGHLGVRLFFVISGYLITGILLRARMSKAVDSDRSHLLKTFYVRRILRIFPAYYVMLLVACLFRPRIRETIIWYLLYASNFLFAVNGSWEPWPTAHLWTLSVEEQFYLLWPPLVLFLPRRFLPAFFAVTILSSIAFRVLMFNLASGEQALYVLTPASFDALGCGAALAALEIFNRMSAATDRLMVVAGVLACISAIAISLMPGPDWLNYVAGESLAVLPMLAVVAAASRGVAGISGALLNNSVLRYIGRISYGVYLYHAFVWAFVVAIWRHYNWPALATGPTRFVLCTPLTIGVASLSWYLLERPFNRIKSRFPYDPNAGSATREVATSETA